jgi:hypothetical protein
MNEAKVKYTLMDELLKDHISNNALMDANINIIVDLKELIRKYYRDGIISEYKLNNHIHDLVKELSSDILNTIGHYRNYFYKINKYTSFYIVYSKDECDSLTLLDPEYKAAYYKKYFSEDNNKNLNYVTKKVISIVERVSKIIPHCYFVDSSDYDENIWIKYLMDSFSKNMFNIVLTNDKILMQNITENSLILNVKGQYSKFIKRDEIFDYILSGVKTEEKFSIELYPLMLAIAGDKKYSIKGIYRHGYAKAAKRINNLIDKYDLPDVNNLDISKLRGYLSMEFSDKETNIIINNYKIINSEYRLMKINQYDLDYKISKYKNSENVKKNTIFDLNDKFFTTDYYLNLDMIFKGEKM